MIINLDTVIYAWKIIIEKNFVYVLFCINRFKNGERLTFMTRKSAEFLKERHSGSLFPAIKHCVVEILTQYTQSIAILEPRSPTEIGFARNEWKRTVLARERANSKCFVTLPRVSWRTTHASIRRTLAQSLLLLPRGGLVRVTSLSHLTLLLPSCRDHDQSLRACSGLKMLTLIILYLLVIIFLIY